MIDFIFLLKSTQKQGRQKLKDERIQRERGHKNESLKEE